MNPLSQNKTSFKIRFTWWAGKQKLGMEGGERGRGDMSLLSNWGRAGPTCDMTSKSNTCKAERRGTFQFISPSLSTLLFSLIFPQNKVLSLKLWNNRSEKVHRLTISVWILLQDSARTLQIHAFQFAHRLPVLMCLRAAKLAKT